MKSAPHWRPSRKKRRVRRAAGLKLVLLAASVIVITGAARSAQGQANPNISGSVTMVLPPRLMAGHPATLAVLGVDGKLAPDVRVEISDGQSIATDRTGRAIFTAPANRNYLIARTSGASAAALIDPAVAESESKPSVPIIASTTDRFWICGAGLRGKADEDSVRINGEDAAVIAASSVCLVTLPPENAKPGPATILVDAPGVQWSVATTFVSLEFAPPKPALKPGEKGQLLMVASGTTEKVRIAVQNRTPGVLQFTAGDVQDVVSSGGSPNSAGLRVQAVSSGDFSFSARLLPTPDAALADRFLLAAEPLAPKELRRRISAISRRLAHHPQDAQSLRAEIGRIVTSTTGTDLEALLNAARDAL